MDMASVSRGVSATAADGKNKYISLLKNEFINSPLASNVVLGLILVGFEKAMEAEFACPCNPTWNGLFALAYFILPGVIASMLMLVIRGFIYCVCNCKTQKKCRCGCKNYIEKCVCACKCPDDCCNVSLFVGAPIITWLELMLFDGRYYACGKTNWSGRFVIIDKADPQKWCEPDNGTLSMERMHQTQQWYFQSQGIGLIFFILFMIVGIIILLVKCKTNSTGNSEDPQQDEEMQNLSPETS